MNPIIGLVKEANSSNVLGDKLTIQYVLEKLSIGFAVTSVAQSGIRIGIDTSAIIVSPELSVFLKGAKDELGTLSDLWDSREQAFDYKTRHSGQFTIEKPCISLLGASAPEWLIKSIPNDAAGGGFTRRVNFVLGSKRSRTIPWPQLNHGPAKSNLVSGLQHIHTHVRGEFKYADNARKLFEDYHRDSVPDEYDDEALAGYKSTKWAHATKIGMALSASGSDRRIIEKVHLEEAIQYVDEVVRTIPIVFRASGESDLVSAADKVLRFMEIKGYCTRGEILRANWRHISSEDLTLVMATLKEGGLIAEFMQGNRIIYKVIPPKGGKTP